MQLQCCMATPKKINQNLKEELGDAAHSQHIQEMFSRKPPTPEDEYFREKDLKIARLHEKTNSDSIENFKPGNAVNTKPSRWQKVISKIMAWFNPKWRP